MGTGTKVAITVAVVLGAVGYLVFATIRSGEALEYYKHVHEVMKDPAAWTQRRLQLHGNVVQGTIVKRRGKLDFRFALHRKGRWIDVAYTGLVPDTFRDCAEVVVKGRMTGERTFAAEAISAKCPSKYDGKRQEGACGAEHTRQVLAWRASR
jgi:cytochrome c-type biogenesis protein CcmE